MDGTDTWREIQFARISRRRTNRGEHTGVVTPQYNSRVGRQRLVDMVIGIRDVGNLMLPFDCTHPRPFFERPSPINARKSKLRHSTLTTYA